MRIYVYPADIEGCGHYRLIWPAQELIRQGHDVKLIMPHDRYNIHAEVRPDGTLNDVFFPQDADVLVMQRVSHRHLADAIPLIRAKGTAVVVDMDDDLSSIHPHNPAWLNFHPKSGLPGTLTSDHSWQHAQRACEAASLVTLSANALTRRYARHGRFEILRNCVPESYLDIEHEDSTVFGWGGSLASHPTDLQQLGMSAARLQREGYTFKIVGHPNGIRSTLHLDNEPESAGIVNISEWPKALSTLGVGIAPLDDNIFNQSKSWLKPLEYASVGVPFVLSPRIEYQHFVKEFGSLDGWSPLARKPSDWLKKLRTMLESSNLRNEMSARGREIASHWTYELRAEDWLRAWVQAVELN